MSVAAILVQLTADGFNVAIDGDGLSVTPASRLSPETRALIRQHKPALVDLLTTAANAPVYVPPPAHATRADAERWMDSIGEFDPVTRREYLEACGFEVQP